MALDTTEYTPPQFAQIVAQLAPDPARETDALAEPPEADDEDLSLLDRQAAKLNGPDHRQALLHARRGYEVFTAFGDRLHLENALAGRSIFLLVNGPSLNRFDLSLLNQRGMVTMGINNGAAVFKPDYWVACDGPERFIEQVWKDPTVCKFIPHALKGRRPRVRQSATDKTLKLSGFTVEQCPNVNFFTRSQQFNAAQFLTEPTFNWGAWNDETDSEGITGGRTTFLVALKLCFWLGAKTCYIVGADFKMSDDAAQNYAFPQARTPAAVRGNNSSYAATNKRCRALRPFFGAAGFTVYNCLPEGESGLTAFAYKPYEEAVAQAALECNEKPIITEGLYDDPKDTPKAAG